MPIELDTWHFSPMLLNTSSKVSKTFCQVQPAQIPASNCPSPVGKAVESSIKDSSWRVLARRQARETWDEIGSLKPSNIDEMSERHHSNHRGWRSHVAKGDSSASGCGNHGCCRRHVIHGGRLLHRSRCRCCVVRSEGWAKQHQGNEDGPQGHHGEMMALVQCKCLMGNAAAMKSIQLHAEVMKEACVACFNPSRWQTVLIARVKP